MFKKTLVVSVLLVLMTGCTSKNVSSVTNVKEHMHESKKLILLMRELDIVVYDRLKSELERDNIRRRYALTLSDSLKNLSLEMQNMIPDVLEKKITKEDAKVYKKLSHQLYVDAQEIYDIAQNYELEKLSYKIDDMKQRCVECHSYYNGK